MFSLAGANASGRSSALSATVTRRAGGSKRIRINLGGEGEVPGAVNVQPESALGPGFGKSNAPGAGMSLKGLQAQGHKFIIASNKKLPFGTSSVDEVISNNVPVDINTPMGQGIQTSEVMRILKPGGIWINNG